MKEEFLAARALLNATLGLVRRFEAKQCDEITLHAASELQVACCRKLRQIIALCDVGQAGGAETIGRSLFETMLAQAVVCAARLRFVDSLAGGEVGFAKELEDNRFKRAKLYFAFKDIQYKKWLDGLTEVQISREWATKELAKEWYDWDQDPDVGHEWIARLRIANTCVGLSVRQLAASAGSEVFRYYLRAYNSQSALVHQSWGGGYAEAAAGEEPGSNVYWFDEDVPLMRALYLGGMVAAICSMYFASIREDYEDRRAELEAAFGEFKRIEERIEREMAKLYS